MTEESHKQTSADQGSNFSMTESILMSTSNNVGKRARVSARRYSPNSSQDTVHSTSSATDIQNGSEIEPHDDNSRNDRSRPLDNTNIRHIREHGNEHTLGTQPCSSRNVNGHTAVSQMPRYVHHSGTDSGHYEHDPTQVELESEIHGDDDDDEDMIVLDEGVSPRELGEYVRQLNFPTNSLIFDNTPQITADVPSLDVLDVLSNNHMSNTDVRNCLAGMCVMINRLIADNRQLTRELHALRTNSAAEGVNRFDNLVFRKSNVRHEYIYPGDSFGIPSANLNKLTDSFDLNGVRRNESAINTLRKFTKYLLENIIPVELHSNFTVRERSGVDRLTELPLELTNMIKEICLEAVCLTDPGTEEDNERTEDLGDYIVKFIKYALQEMRRIPRKSKRVIERSNRKERVETTKTN